MELHPQNPWYLEVLIRGRIASYHHNPNLVGCAGLPVLIPRGQCQWMWPAFSKRPDRGVAGDGSMPLSHSDSLHIKKQRQIIYMKFEKNRDFEKNAKYIIYIYIYKYIYIIQNICCPDFCDFEKKYKK